LLAYQEVNTRLAKQLLGVTQSNEEGSYSPGTEGLRRCHAADEDVELPALFHTIHRF